MPARRLERIFIIAGPNGDGKTTFAMEFLPRELGILDFVDADTIPALRRARKRAQKEARQTGTPLVEGVDGKPAWIRPRTRPTRRPATD